MKGFRKDSGLLMLIIFAVVVATASAVSDPIETAALLAFKESIGDTKGVLSKWQGSDPCGPPSWTGISCASNATASNFSHVTELYLLWYGFTGTISPQLGDLTYLRILNLMGNRIKGKIPPELGTIKSIQLLLLNGNQLTGPIPPELGNLASMIRLQLDENLLSGNIPQSLGNLTNLRHMHLNNNSLTGTIPKEINGNNGSKLVHVLVDNNNLTGPLPASLGSLPEIVIIQVDNNPSIGGHLPVEWVQNPSLMKLSARNCSLTGTIPNLADATNLTYLDLSKNQFAETFPSNFSSRLITIDVSENNLVGPIPDTIGDLQEFQALRFAYNRFNGTIPDTLGTVFSSVLESQHTLVDLRNNSLTGIDLKTTFRLTRFRVMIDRSVSDRISGNPICDATNIADKYRLKYCFEQGNHTVGDHASGGLAGCAKCDPPQVSVLESSGKCRCAQPIRMDLRLKSPSFTFFDRFRHEFFSLVYTMLNLSDSQVSIRELDWQAGPRLHILLFLFPLSTTFDDEEYERIFDTVASWEMSAVTEWKLSVIGPYDLLEFHKVQEGPSNRTSKVAIAGIVVFILVAVAVATCAFMCLNRKYRTKLLRKTFVERSPAMMPPGLKLAGVKAFTFEEIKQATNNFHVDCVLGRGGYGHVYRGILPDGMAVAVKRASGGSLQGSEQFYTEIELLSRLHHRNLVSLIGFCNDQGEQMLIYEFLPRGNLRDHLKPTVILDYATRIRIALGTAKAILYLHTEANPPIFHRDIKTNNILLDQNLNVKISDFGISKLAPAPEMSGTTPDGISTNVRGTPGYLDPEYFMTKKLTDKSDVFSFGVVLLELITGMLPIAHGKNMVREVRDALNDGKFWDLVDPCMGSYSIKGIEELLVLGLKCVDTDPVKRPQMIEVTRDLDMIMRDTVPPESPTYWNNGDSFGRASERWPLNRSRSFIPNNSYWTSEEEFIASRSYGPLGPPVSIELQPR
nr:probable LRR receptor-like serine/threonine-protein kinase At1g06840 [Physcomitrium patens]|eukprot:XP_024391349.1 probable LRR receptor-like serine/threonine-protein kinase At1g06840 [Physcomitrella patens]